MRKLLGFLILAIISTKSLAADISDQLKKLEGLYDRGSITEKEFLKAKSILLQIDLETSQKVEKIQKKFDKPKASDFIIRPFRSNLGVSFERMEMLFGDQCIPSQQSNVTCPHVVEVAGWPKCTISPILLLFPITALYGAQIHFLTFDVAQAPCRI